MRIGTHEFNVKENTYIMGILNVTPDSFSDGGKIKGIDAALKRAEQMMYEGAAILDIGGESTRPGYTPVSEEEEMERVLPVVEAVKQRLDIPISVDTYKSVVAEAAIQVGADLINDIWGLKADARMAEVIAKHEVACCLMH
ncbi:MAG: dihydropteroate synthase, partial [Agathobacter sp.]|nr:dihydropteroate synthase [Agathobacter sp.]